MHTTRQVTDCLSFNHRKLFLNFFLLRGTGTTVYCGISDSLQRRRFQAAGECQNLC